MSDTDRNAAAGDWFGPGTAVAAAMLRQAESWASTQGELLFGMEAVWSDWMKRQSQAIEAGSRSLRQMCDCRNPADLLQLQQQFMSDMLRRAASDLGGLASEALAVTARVGDDRFKAAARSPAPAREREPQRPSESGPVQRAAAE